MFNFINKLLSINEDFTFIGEKKVFSVDIPLRGWSSFDDIELSDNSTATKFFNVRYRYTFDGCNYTDWEDFNDVVRTNATTGNVGFPTLAGTWTTSTGFGETINITADFGGVAGNAVAIVAGDGVSLLSQLIVNWNTANPLNTVNLVEANATGYKPGVGETFVLIGGSVASGHERFTDSTGNLHIGRFELIEGWDTIMQPTLYFANSASGSVLNIFETQAAANAGAPAIGIIFADKTYPEPMPSPVDVTKHPLSLVLELDGEVFINQYGIQTQPIGSLNFNVTHNKLVEAPIKNDFIVEFEITRVGSDNSGILTLNTIDVTGTYSQEFFDVLSFEDTVFKDIIWDNERWNLIWLNLFKKYYKHGIVPDFIERDETKFGETVDEDYIVWWKSACYYWALQIELGIQKIEEIRQDKVDLKDFLEQRTALICPDAELEFLQYIQQYFIDEMSQRGTHNIHLKKDFGGVVSGEDAVDLFISEYLNYGFGVYVVEIANFTGKDVSLTPYTLERDNADDVFAVSYGLGQFGVLKQGEVITLSSFWIPQQDKVILAAESTILSGLTGTTQIRISKNSLPIDHLGDKAVAGWGTNRKFQRSPNESAVIPTSYNPLTSLNWFWSNEVPPTVTVSTSDIVFTTFGSHAVNYGKIITGGKAINGELLRFICFQECDEFLFEFLPRHLCGWNVNNTSPIFKGVTGRYQLNKTPDTTADVNNFGDWCLKNEPAVEWLEDDGLGILLTESGDNLTTEVGASEKLLQNFYFERDSFLIKPAAGDSGICHAVCVNTLLSYELTFWARFDSVPTSALNVVVRAFQDNVPKRLETINTLSNATEISIITNATTLIPEKYYFVRCVIYNWEAATLSPAEALTNIGVGENVRFFDREIDKLEFEIFRSNAGSAVGMGLWDVKFSPLKLDKNSSYVNGFNVNNVILQNRNQKVTKSQLEESIVRYLLPYGVTFQPQYVNLFDELSIGFLLQENGDNLLQENLGKLIITVN